ncbi:MAG: riboflavin synthase [Planctomycetota bacterium]|jgi:riboflavin synthase
MGRVPAGPRGVRPSRFNYSNSTVFTGIIEGSPKVLHIERQGSGMRLWIPAPNAEWAVEEGESVAVSGCCLTVVHVCEPTMRAGGRPAEGCQPGASLPEGTPGATMVFDLSAETLDRTHFGDLTVGQRINLERAMRLSDRLSGHLVAGHVDGGGSIVAMNDSGDGGQVYTFEVDEGLERYLIEKGSVTLDGISLTVVQPRERQFDVALIPVTLEATNLGSCKIGQRINVEADMVGKWIERLVVTG